MAHALVNGTALGLYALSLGLRLGGQRGAARALAGVGFGVVSLGGMLGGELVYTLGVNVSHLLYPKPPDEFTDCCASADNCNLFALKEKAITHSAGTYSVTV